MWARFWDCQKKSVSYRIGQVGRGYETLILGCRFKVHQKKGYDKS